MILFGAIPEILDVTLEGWKVNFLCKWSRWTNESGDNEKWSFNSNIYEEKVS